MIIILQTTHLWWVHLVGDWGDWILHRAWGTSFGARGKLRSSFPSPPSRWSTVFSTLAWTSAKVGLQVPAHSLGVCSCQILSLLVSCEPWKDLQSLVAFKALQYRTDVLALCSFLTYWLLATVSLAAVGTSGYSCFNASNPFPGTRLSWA